MVLFKEVIMKKIIDFKKYSKSQQTIDSIQYNDDNVSIIEIINAYAMCNSIQPLKTLKEFSDIEMETQSIKLIFEKTGKEGISLGIPTISSLRECDKVGIQGRKYPFPGILFNGNPTFERQDGWRNLEGISKSIDNAFKIRQSSSNIPNIELAFRSSRPQYGHVNVFRLKEIFLIDDTHNKIFKHVPTDNEGRIRGLDSTKFQSLYKPPTGQLTF